MKSKNFVIKIEVFTSSFPEETSTKELKNAIETFFKIKESQGVEISGIKLDFNTKTLKISTPQTR